MFPFVGNLWKLFMQMVWYGTQLYENVVALLSLFCSLLFWTHAQFVTNSTLLCTRPPPFCRWFLPLTKLSSFHLFTSCIGICIYYRGNGNRLDLKNGRVCYWSLFVTCNMLVDIYIYMYYKSIVWFVVWCCDVRSNELKFK